MFYISKDGDKLSLLGGAGQHAKVILQISGLDESSTRTLKIQ